MTKVTLDGVGPQCRRYVWGRKDEEFIADFILLTKRVLTEAEYKLFRFHFLLGAEWRLCARKLGVDKGTFYHFVYRIQQKLGRAFRETAPYALFPLDEYFHGGQHQAGTMAGFEPSTDGEAVEANVLPIATRLVDPMLEPMAEPMRPPAKVVPIAPPLAARGRKGTGARGSGRKAA